MSAFEPSDLAEGPAREFFTAERDAFVALHGFHTTAPDEEALRWAYFMEACSAAKYAEAVARGKDPSLQAAAANLTRLNGILFNEGGWGIAPLRETLPCDRLATIGKRVLTKLVEQALLPQLSAVA